MSCLLNSAEVLADMEKMRAAEVRELLGFEENRQVDDDHGTSLCMRSRSVEGAIEGLRILKGMWNQFNRFT